MSWGRLPDNPFVGLRPFESHESLLFFGRHEQSVELLEQLHATRFLAVVGSSGSGKSSLVRAGLIPKLQAGFLVEDRDAWRFAVTKPGDRPLANLAAALAGALGGGAGGGLADEIRERGLLPILERATPALAGDDANLLVLVDQFEELFRFGLHTAGGARGEEAAHFVSLLLELARQREAPIYVALTMRSDFLGDCDAFLGLPEAMNQSQYLVPRLTRRQRREAIAAPVKLYRAAIAPRLVDRLLNETVDARDDLPVLQHALMRTWSAWKRDGGEAIDVAHYEAIGTIARALSEHAEEAMAGMGEAERELTRRIFQALTETDAGNRRIRRPARLGEIEAITGARRDAILAIVDRFTSDGRSFLVVSAGGGERDPLIDISHESLIRQWERLRDWVDKEAESARVYRRLADTARLFDEDKAELYRGAALEVAEAWREKQSPNATWARRYDPDLDHALGFLEASRADAAGRARKREEARKRALRRTRIVAAVFAIGFLLTLALGLWALREKRRADSARNQARKAEQRAKDALEQAVESGAKARAEQARAEAETLRAEEQTQLAEEGRRRAEAAERRAAMQRLQALARFLESKAEQALKDSGASLLLSALLATESLAAADTPEGRKALARVLPLLPQALAAFPGPATTAAAFSTDGERLATARITDPERSTQREQDVVLRARRSGEELARRRLEHPVDQLIYGPDGRLLAASGRERTTVLRADTADAPPPETLVPLEELHGFDHGSTSERKPRVAFSPDGTLLAAASYDQVLLFRTDGWQERPFRVPGGALIPYFDPGGRVLFSANAASTTMVDLGQEAPEPVDLFESPRPIALAVSRDGGLMAVLTHDGLRVGAPDWQAWRSGTPPTPPHQLSGGRRRDAEAWSLVFGPAGELLTVDRAGSARLWAVRDGVYRERLRFAGEWGDGDLSRDGRWVVTSRRADPRDERLSLDEATTLWHTLPLDDTVERRPLASVSRETDWSAQATAWSPGRDQFAFVDTTGLSVFDAATWLEVASVPFGCETPELWFETGGQWLVVRCARDLKVLATRGWRLVAEPEVPEVVTVRFSPDGGSLAAIREDETATTVDVFEIASRKRLARLSHDNPVRPETGTPDHGLRVAQLRWSGERRLAIQIAAGTSERWTSRSTNDKSRTTVDETHVWNLEDGSRLAWRRRTERTVWEAPSMGPDEAPSETTASEESEGPAELVAAAEGWPASPGEPERYRPEELSVSTRDATLSVRSERRGDLIDEACSRLPTGFTPKQASEFLGDPAAPGACVGRATAHRARGRDLARLGYPVAALAALRRALELAPALAFDPEEEQRLYAAQGALEEGRELARRGELAAARRRLAEALELNPALVLDPEAELRRYAPDL